MLSYMLCCLPDYKHIFVIFLIFIYTISILTWVIGTCKLFLNGKYIEYIFELSDTISFRKSDCKIW